MPTQTPTAKTLWVRNQYDTAPPLRIQMLHSDGSPMDLTGSTVTVDVAWASGDHHYSPYRRLITDAPCVLDEDPSQGGVAWHPQAGDLVVVGLFHLRFCIHWVDGTQQQVPPEYPFGLRVHPRIGGPT